MGIRLLLVGNWKKVIVNLTQLTFKTVGGLLTLQSFLTACSFWIEFGIVRFVMVGYGVV